MEKTLYELRTFHLTGRKIDNDFASVAELHLVPALLSRYRDLTQLRHDYPLVLVDKGGDLFVKSLSSITNGVLQEIAPQGIEGERTRRNLLNLESEIRSLTSRNGGGALSELWDVASDRLLSNSRISEEEKELLQGNLARARRCLGMDGEVIECNGEAPASLFAHAWETIEKGRTQGVLKQLQELIIGLSGILKADYAKSDQGRSPESLRTSMGTSFEDAFDFAAMSSSLTKSSTESPLPKRRRERVQSALSVLESQRFFACRNDGEERSGKEPYAFIVDSCTEALETYRSRIPDMVDFIKAVRIAELELGNEYEERKHDSFFKSFAEESLNSDDISLFPSCLVRLDSSKYDAANKATLVEILCSDLPIKVLFETNEVLKNSSVKSDRISFDGWELQLANLAISLNSAYVLQATSSNLYLMSEGISEGLKYKGPALFSIFSASRADFPNLPPYLVAASAAQSRAFPAFVYDPGAGENWSARFHVDGNPQVESIWPVDGFYYEDQDLQLVSEELPFTLVDFAAADRRLSANFVSVPQAKWHENMVPVAEYLRLADDGADDKVPYILMVDDDDVLHRVVMTHNIVAAARGYAQLWRNLQELGGINNSHALALLDREKEAWEEEKKREIEEIESKYREELGEVAAEGVPAVEEEGAAEEVVEERGPIEEAFIETARCNSCDECTKKNDRMFAYDENKKAYLKDIDAGSFKDLVESAELCKVAIIHPGKPRNPDEPNLEELIKRAEPFN